MAENAFRFFRGTCHLFYEDLRNSDALPRYPVSWICGDLHLENFGTFKGDNRLVYFDLNDFDESLLAPATWEVVRMVTSIYTGFSSLDIARKEATRVANLYLETYSNTLARGKARYIEPQTSRGIIRLFLEKVCERKQKELIRQRTMEKGDKLVFRTDNVRLFPLEKSLKKELMSFLTGWLQKDKTLLSRHIVLDAAFRVAGTGSLGLKRYVFLVRNKDEPKKHLMIDMKQAVPSSVEPWLDIRQPAWTSDAERVLSVQERMQNTAPALLSACTFRDDHYVLKEMQPVADKIDFLVIRDRFKDIERVITDMAMLTASAQLRSAGRQGAALPDELIAFGRDRHWQQGLLHYAMEYTAQVEKDYNAYFKAYKAGFFQEGN